MTYQPQFTITPGLLARVENIAGLREKILAATVHVPWIPALQKDTRLHNAQSSTAIEGNPLTLEQVRAVEEGRELAGVTDRAKREVLNYFAGLRFIETNLKKSRLTHEVLSKPQDHRRQCHGSRNAWTLPHDWRARGPFRATATIRGIWSDV